MPMNVSSLEQLLCSFINQSQALTVSHTLTVMCTSCDEYLIRLENRLSFHTWLVMSTDCDLHLTRISIQL